jgi:hypothetical protein
MASRSKPKRTKEEKLGLIVVEVIRATNEGRSPTKQKEISKAVARKGESIPGSTLSGYIGELEGKGILQTDGHNVTLASELTTLTDSLAIDVLLIAYEGRDENGCFTADAWTQICTKLKITKNRSTALLDEFKICGYLLTEKTDPNSFEELNVRAINEDLFYLKPARRAKLKKLPPKAKAQAPSR